MRGKDDYVPEQGAVLVEISLDDGTQLKGKLMVSKGRAITEVLNGTSAFFEFEATNGDRCCIAKAHILTLKSLEVAKPMELDRRLRVLDDFEPHRILGVPSEAGPEEVRQAYLRMAKSYHPDCFANVALPPEVKDYLAGMVRRINAAYAALEVPRPDAAKKAAKPVYTTRPRSHT